MDKVLKALADPSRRLLLDVLNARDGQTLSELCKGLSMARQSVSKHLAVLEGANLVTTEWRGREKLHHFNRRPDQGHRRALDQPVRPCTRADAGNLRAARIRVAELARRVGSAVGQQ